MKRWAGNKALLKSRGIALEIWVEIWSESNTAEEIERKRKTCFKKGALEFWYCDRDGKISFFNPNGAAAASGLCPEFPAHINA